jgi:peptide/nickel transport system substrate-binding protein
MAIGILPKHLWEEIPSESFTDSPLNLSPVGAGPFKVAAVKKDNGVPGVLSLVRNRDYVLGKPLLSGLDIAVYANQAALASAVRSGAVQSTAALDPETVATTKFSSNVLIEKVPTERTISLYRAKNEIVLSHVPLVTILNRYIDKEAILDTVEGSNGLSSTDNTHSPREEVAEALKTAGYTQNPDGTYAKGKIPLGFSIAVENTPRLLLAARNLANQLGALGMIVSVQAFDPGVVLDEVAAARFPVLLTDELPPASYMPVVELYKETVPYVARAQVHIDTPAVLSRSVLRFSNAHTWYTKTDRVWKWLVKSN